MTYLKNILLTSFVSFTVFANAPAFAGDTKAEDSKKTEKHDHKEGDHKDHKESDHHDHKNGDHKDHQHKEGDGHDHSKDGKEKTGKP